VNETITINGRPVGPGHPTYVIAELSANHDQKFERAVESVHAARAAGADAVKLQTYTPDTLTLDLATAPFQVGAGTLWTGQTLYRLYAQAYMPWEWQPKLKRIAEAVGLDLFSSRRSIPPPSTSSRRWACRRTRSPPSRSWTWR
jgi:pseudaminic acid synthase